MRPDIKGNIKEQEKKKNTEISFSYHIVIMFTALSLSSQIY